MSTVDTSQPLAARYTSVAIALHWAIVVGILFNIYLGLRMGQARGMERFEIFQVHKSVGLTVLILSLCRLAWRLTHRPPPYARPLKGWELAVSHLVHFAFYFLIIAIPLTGWIVVSASPMNLPTLLFKVVPFPHIGFIHDLPMDQRRGLEGTVGGVHGLLVLATVGLLLLHVGAVAKHLVIDRDTVTGRMIPFKFLRTPRKDK